MLLIIKENSDSKLITKLFAWSNFSIVAWSFYSIIREWKDRTEYRGIINDIIIDVWIDGKFFMKKLKTTKTYKNIYKINK